MYLHVSFDCQLFVLCTEPGWFLLNDVCSSAAGAGAAGGTHLAAPECDDKERSLPAVLP